jgi:hypothetical protein
MNRHMLARFSSMALLLCGTAALPDDVRPEISRPITLPSGTLDFTLHGTYTNWTVAFGPTIGRITYAGETLAFGIDYGAFEGVQVGLAVALPIHPGAAFGSILGSAAFAVGPHAAVRVDTGYENIGLNGNADGGITGELNFNHISRYFAGLGVPLKIPLSPRVAFVGGRAGAAQFGHFNNIGSEDGSYVGASALSQAGADLIVVSGGSGGINSIFGFNLSDTILGFNLPFGVLLQPDPHLALTLFTGFSAAVALASSNSQQDTQARYFVPLGIEAVVTTGPVLDVGLRFFLDGPVGMSGGETFSNPGYADRRALMLWFGFHIG